MTHQRRLFLALIFLAPTLVACTPMIHGVPEDRWARMNETERTAAREAYAERQRQWQLERADQARRDAEAAEAHRQEAHEQAHRNREQIEAIHRGESGVYGDLIQVSVSGGSMDFYGKRMPYESFTFRLANREQRMVSIRSTGNRGYRSLEVPVSFADGTFTFDVGRQPIRLLQSPNWRSGALYSGLTTGKHSRSDGAGLNMRVEIVPQSGMIVLERSHRPEGPRPEPPPHPPTAPAPQEMRVMKAESVGLFPDGFQTRKARQCVNIGPLGGRNANRPETRIEHNGISTIVRVLEIKANDIEQRKKICHANGTGCKEVSDWMKSIIGSRTIPLYEQEVIRLYFENGGTLLLSATTIDDRKMNQLCWD